MQSFGVLRAVPKICAGGFDDNFEFLVRVGSYTHSRLVLDESRFRPNLSCSVSNVVHK